MISYFLLFFRQMYEIDDRDLLEPHLYSSKYQYTKSNKSKQIAIWILIVLAYILLLSLLISLIFLILMLTKLTVIVEKEIVPVLHNFTTDMDQALQYAHWIEHYLDLLYQSLTEMETKLGPVVKAIEKIAAIIGKL